MGRFWTLSIVVVATLALAVYSGLSSYHASPEGMLLYTPLERCPVMQHSFTLAYVLCLMIASIATGLTAVVAFITSTMHRFSTRKHQLRSIAMLCLVAVGIFLGASLLNGFFETQLPLHIKSGCESV